MAELGEMHNHLEGAPPPHHFKVSSSDVLRKLSQYKNPELINLFFRRSKGDLSLGEIENLFEDMKKLMFLVYLTENERHLLREVVVTKEIELIDDIWHQFILMTRDYHLFCYQTFGQYVHHTPESATESEAEVYDYSLNKKVIEQIKVIDRIWGDSIIIRWYHYLPKLNRNGFWHRLFRR